MGSTKAGTGAREGGQGNLAARRRIHFVNRFFYPDESATSVMVTDLAEHLAGAGHDVSIITSRLAYADPDIRHVAREDWRGVTIRRVATTGFGRGNLAGRAVDYLSFYASSFLETLRQARRGDIVVAKTDPPLLGVTVGLAARLKGARRVNWLQDIFPEVATETGVSVPLPGLLKRLRNRSLTQADLNIAIGTRMADFVAGETGGQARTSVIHNFVDDALAPDHAGAAALRQSWGYESDDFIVGYSGNLGRAHDVDTVLGAAERLQSMADIKFLFVGGGHARADVEARANALGLRNVVTRPYVPRKELARSLTLPDVHWVTLIPALEGMIVPSKLYGIAAAGRAAIVVGDVDGDLARTIIAHGFGMAVEPGHSEAFAGAVLALRDDAQRRNEMERAARQFAEGPGARQRAFALWDEAIAGL